MVKFNDIFKTLVFTIFCVLSFALHAAQVDTSTRSFGEKVRTLRVRSLTDNLTTGTPVIVLNSGDAVSISFDLLEDDRRYLRYEVIHCNADWQPSVLSYLEYLDGFNEGTIDDYDFSGATTVAYVHYQLVLPNQDFRFKLSGNYLVRIYDEDDPDTTIIQARFCVSEQTAPVAWFVTSRTDVDYNSRHQQLEFSIDFDNAPVANIFNDVLVTVEQNGRPDAVHNISHPLRVSGRTAFYEHNPQLIFDAGNEYRRFETISTTFTPMNVDAVEYHAPYYNHYLKTDVPRSASEYLYDRTLNGGFVIREYNSDDGDLDADYTIVHFSLEMPELFDRKIYIDSDAFERRLDSSTRMTYNSETGRYEKAALLKQGAYSYQYVAVPDGTAMGLTSTVEGDKYQTRNQYTLSVYSRVPGERYDRLIERITIFANQ